MDENYTEVNEIEQKLEKTNNLNTNENQEEIKNKLALLFERLLLLESNHSNFLRNCEIIRDDHFNLFGEFLKIKSDFIQLNPTRKVGFSSNEKNDKQDRNLNKLHSTVKKKEINIDSLNKLESLSVSSAKNNKSLKTDITPFSKKARPDSHSQKAPDIRSKFNKKEATEKDTYLQTDTDTQIQKKSKLKLSPSKSINKSPFHLNENDKHKKTISEFKKTSTSKDLSNKKTQIEKMFEKEKEGKKGRENNEYRSATEKNNDKSASRNEKKNEKAKLIKNNESNVKNEKGKTTIIKKPPLYEKKKTEEKNPENTVKNEVNSNEINISEPKSVNPPENVGSEQNFSTIDGNKNRINESSDQNKDQAEVINTN